MSFDVIMFNCLDDNNDRNIPASGETAIVAAIGPWTDGIVLKHTKYLTRGKQYELSKFSIHTCKSMIITKQLEKPEYMSLRRWHFSFPIEATR